MSPFLEQRFIDNCSELNKPNINEYKILYPVDHIENVKNVAFFIQAQTNQVPGILVQDSTLQVLANAGSPEWVESQMLPRLVEV